MKEEEHLDSWPSNSAEQESQITEQTYLLSPPVLLPSQPQAVGHPGMWHQPRGKALDGAFPRWSSASWIFKRRHNSWPPAGQQVYLYLRIVELKQRVTMAWVTIQSYIDEKKRKSQVSLWSMTQRRCVRSQWLSLWCSLVSPMPNVHS